MRCVMTIFKLQLPVGHHLVAIGIGFRKVVAGVEKKHGNFRQPLAQHVQDDHVLGLKAAGEAGQWLSRRGGAFAIDAGPAAPTIKFSSG